MGKLSHIFFIALLTFYMIAGELQKKYGIQDDKKLRVTFNKLLETITTVNEERLDALKKFYELQNYLPIVGRANENIVTLIIPNDKEDSIEEFYKNGPNIAPGGTPGILKFLKNPSKQISFDHRNLKNDVSEDILEAGNKSNVLREWKGCNKSAAKHCKKACKKAFDEVCTDYKCSKHMKKMSKKSCKKLCNSEFSHDNDDNNDDY